LLSLVRVALRQIRAYRRFVRLSPEERARREDVPNEFVAALVALGPTFVKLGQILSTRPDVLPKEYIAALEVLQEGVPPSPFRQVRAIVEHELGRSLETAFRSFDAEPVASASLAQVHFAVLPGGEPVAVKVQRPGIHDRVDQDLEALGRIVSLLARISPTRTRRANLVDAFAEFRRYTLRELDFAEEARTMERFRHNFRDWKGLVIPKVFRDHTAAGVLTMERADGVRLKAAVERLDSATRERLVERLVALQMKMFLTDGLFHADLHPGNILFGDDGTITLLDFGMIGELDEDERDRFLLYWLAVVQHQTRRAFHHFRMQTRPLPGADEAAFFASFERLAEQFYRSTLTEMTITQVYLAMIASGYRHGFVFPSGLLLHAKAITTAEALTFTLAPGLRFDQVTRPVVARAFAQRFADGPRLRQLAGQFLPGFLLLGEILPAEARDPYREAGRAHPLAGEIVDGLLARLRELERGAGLLRLIVDPSAREVLRRHHSEAEVEGLLDESWRRYRTLEPEIPVLDQIGPTFILHLAGAVRAMNQALVAAGHDPDKAADLLNRIGWRVYERMGEGPFLLASAFTDDPLKKLRIATGLFRGFPFGPPAYRWRDVEAGENVVAFDCERCPVADYFKRHGEGELCYRTFCQLDFPLAERWGGMLERSGTLAVGAPACDFRWALDQTTEKQSRDR
jgi:ubiquinone biosynthesis protein